MGKSDDNLFYNNKDNTDEKSNESKTNIKDMPELMKSLNVLNVGYTGLTIVLIAVIINMKYMQWSRVQLLDNIYDTNFAQEMEDLTEAPKLTNRLYLISTVMFISIIYDAYITQISLDESERDEKEIENAWKNYVAIILIFTGSVINFSVLNNPKNQT
ncbi:MAG: hypothetical protein ACI398_10750 [Clostridium sp.]